MSVMCPKCGTEVETGEEMETSEAMPYENMRAAPGALLAVDENGEVTQTYATPEQVRARGWRILTPGSAPDSMPENPATQVAMRRAQAGETGMMPDSELDGGLGTSYAPPIRRAPVSGASLARALRSR